MKRSGRLGIGVLVTVIGLAAGGQSTPASRAALVARLAEGASPTPLSSVLTPLLLDYVEAVLPRDKTAELYAAASRADFLSRLQALTGKDLIDMGAEMFAFYEAKPAAGDPAAWTTFPAGPFLVHVHPGSAADRDRALIAGEMEAAAAAIAEALDLGPAFEAARRILASAEAGAPGRIPVRLYGSRRDEGTAKIRKESQGSATLGATIVEKAGRLTFQIDILYFNALSLAVLEHEAAHAVVLLATFDPAALTAAPLAGEADLRKAFFAGYRKIPTFLQEGLGDWGYFYRGFHRGWGLLPPPDAIVTGLEDEGRTLPLAELLAGDIRYAAKNRKAYSLQAASFIDFLLRTEDRNKAKAWLLSNEINAAKTFERAFGRSLAAAEKSWRSGRKEASR